MLHTKFRFIWPCSFKGEYSNVKYKETKDDIPQVMTKISSDLSLWPGEPRKKQIKPDTFLMEQPNDHPSKV
jgi:hypothetical protein